MSIETAMEMYPEERVAILPLEEVVVTHQQAEVVAIHHVTEEVSTTQDQEAIIDHITDRLQEADLL